ncbi:MAG TPA: nitroreductase family protein [Nitrososphaeraceae archaeon]|jgi:nitroreductase|nr:nitroreductase family protein [Nitrososphaeraceae archaeon]
MMKNMQELDKVIRKRKMIRKYDQSREVPDKIINKLIDNASRAPSAGHTQVQEFVVIKEPSIKRKLMLASVNQEQVEEAPVLIVVCSNTSRSVGRYGERGKEFYSIIDGAFASMLILLTATNEGLGASFVGAFNDEKVSEILGLPEHVRPIGIIALGYSDEKPARLERIQRDRLIHYERW